MCKQRRRPGEGGDLMVHDGRGLGWRHVMMGLRALWESPKIFK